MTKHKLLNSFQTLVIVIIMLLLMTLLGLLVGGLHSMFIAFFLSVVLIIFFPSIKPSLLAKLYGGKELLREEALELYAYLDELCKRGGIEAKPLLYIVDEPTVLAFTVGHRREAALMLSSGLINRLELPEIVGVIAHEMAHIINNDLWLMGLTDIISRIMGIFSVLGQLLVILFLPLYLFADISLPWTGILILLFAPMVNSLLQLMLSRVREYDADLTAAYLMGTPTYLAEALKKIEFDKRFFPKSIFFPVKESQIPSFFRTHPATKSRIEKLESIEVPKHISRMRFYDRYSLERYEEGHEQKSLWKRYLLGL